MRKLHKAVVMTAVIGSVSLIGAGTASADGWAPAYGGQPVYAQPAYVQPVYAQPAYAQPAYAQPVYGQPMYGPQASGQPSYGPQASGQQGYAQPSYGRQDDDWGRGDDDGWRHGGREEGRRDVDVKQVTQCRSHDLNLDILGEVGIANGLLGNALNGEGHPGGQATHLGSTAGCNNQALSK
ncbi:hypothetical protein [Streptomyces humicola]|uniref:hypothetical protein n=1 Tax=Streptomyces humicola TaxID=2953240 RepID=UPI0022B27066